MARTYGNKTVQIEFLSSGFKKLLFSPEIRETVYQTAKAIARDAGDGFTPSVYYARQYAGGRIVGTVFASTPEAREAEATDKVLSRAASVRR